MGGWLRRGRGDGAHAHGGGTPPPADPDEQDRPEVLAAKVVEQVRFLNRNSGQLPSRAMVDARQLTDTLAAIVATSEVRPLDIYASITVRRTLDDYLPTTIQRYLAVPPPQRDVPRTSGGTPTTSLEEQIDALLIAAANVLEAAQNSDVDALMAQGAFLTTKFSGSDLDL